MRVLLCNDDGIDAPGLRYLVQALGEHECEIVAPMTDQSGASHSTTRVGSLRVNRRSLEGIEAAVVAGTPVDAVKFKLYDPARPFDVMVSGINAGENGGLASYYSGTVAAAREAALRGVPAISVSVWRDDTTHYLAAGRFIGTWLPRWFGPQNTLRPVGPTLLNVNFPACDPSKIKGIHLARQSIASYDDCFLKISDDGKQSEYEIRFGSKNARQILQGSDDWALQAGFITIAPLRVETTCSMGLEWLGRVHRDFSETDDDTTADFCTYAGLDP